MSATPRDGLRPRRRALCNDATLSTAADDSVSIVGDPTEAAFVAAALRAGVDKTRMDAALPRTAEVRSTRIGSA